MADALKAFAASTIATVPSPAASGTSLVVAAGHGARFPEVPFNVTVCPADADADITNSEILRVTNASTDTFTVLRAQEGTSARTIIVGDRIFQGVTPKMIEDREPVQTAASQAEAEAGSVTAIRSFTPERIKQAIIALGLNTGLASTVFRTTLSGTAVDITAKESVKSLTGDATLTFSGTPGTGQEFRLTLNADSTARTVTLPADIYSIQRQGTVGSVVVPASGTLLLGFRYTGARWEMLGDPAATVGSGSYELATNNKTLCFGVGDVGGSTAVALNAITGYIRIPWACTVVGGTWAVQANGSSPTCTVDILRVASGTALPSASFVGTGTKPALASGNAASGATTDWENTTFAAGDLVAAKVTATSGVATWIGLQLTISRT